MQITKGRGVVIAAAILVGGACVASQPATADPANSIDSREIKNGTIKVIDLNQLIKTRLSQAKTALQEIPDNSVTTPKLADNAVTNPKIDDNAVTGAELADNSVSSTELADNSVGSSEVVDAALTAADLGPNSVTSEELANNSVDTGAVADGSLTATDVASVRGVANLDFPTINAGSCQVLQIATGNTLTGDLILVTPGPTMPGIVSVEGRQANAGSANIAVIACNHAGVNLNPGATDISWAVLEN